MEAGGPGFIDTALHSKLYDTTGYIGLSKTKPTKQKITLQFLQRPVKRLHNIGKISPSLPIIEI